MNKDVCTPSHGLAEVRNCLDGRITSLTLVVVAQTLTVEVGVPETNKQLQSLLNDDIKVLQSLICSSSEAWRSHLSRGWPDGRVACFVSGEASRRTMFEVIMVVAVVVKVVHGVVESRVSVTTPVLKTVVYLSVCQRLVRPGLARI